MFTGIIEGVGEVRAVKKQGDWLEIEISADFDLENTNIGESIAVNGCCTTVTSRLGKIFWASLSPETLAASTLKDLKKGDPVHLERALKVGQRLGGHIVQGHVDGVGKVLKINKLNNGVEFLLEAPEKLSRYLVEKGSVAIDGVSLTVNSCERNQFRVVVIPHTKLATTFIALSVGDFVNLEVDIIGKYVEKMNFLQSDAYRDEESSITKEFLKKHGF